MKNYETRKDIAVYLNCTFQITPIIIVTTTCDVVG